MDFLKNLKKRYHAWRYRRLISSQNFKSKTDREIFTETFEKRYWRSAESASGAGSELRQTETLRRDLPDFLKKWEVRTVLDLPCGDFNWMQKVDLQGIEYIGADIVEPLVFQNREKFSTPNRRFECLDLCLDPLPRADLVLVRDCFVHLNFEKIEMALANLRRSGSRFLLTTSFPKLTKNENIQTGYWRPLNLEIEPFRLPPRLDFLLENCSESHGAFSDKSLILFDLQG